jgi:hypothetical protein
MKTFAILFFCLSILNLPVLLVYVNSTKGNDYSDLDKIFSYFTLGNLGRSNQYCEYASINSENVINFHCADQVEYMHDIGRYGLLY